MTASTHPPGLVQLKSSVPLDLEPPKLRSSWERGGRPQLGTGTADREPSLSKPFQSTLQPCPEPLMCARPWWALRARSLTDSSLTCKIQICSYFRDKAQRREGTCPRSQSWQAVESGFKAVCVIPERTLTRTPVPGGRTSFPPSLPPAAIKR